MFLSGFGAVKTAGRADLRAPCGTRSGSISKSTARLRQEDLWVKWDLNKTLYAKKNQKIKETVGTLNIISLLLQSVVTDVKMVAMHFHPSIHCLYLLLARGSWYSCPAVWVGGGGSPWTGLEFITKQR